MGILFSMRPSGLANYREATRRHGNTAGIQFQRFTCRVCGHQKPCEGRKRVSKVAKDGYKCADCAGACAMGADAA